MKTQTLVGAIATCTVASLLLSVNVQAQSDAILDGNELKQSEAGSRHVIVSYGLDANETVSGFQFDLKYDSSKFAVADLSNCLSGLPETHQGEFSVCNNVPEKSLVRFVVLDLGRNRPLDVSGNLGTVEFVRKNNQDGALLSRSALPSVENSMLADLEGMELKRNSSAEPIQPEFTFR